MAISPLNLWRQIADNFNFNVDPNRSEHENAEEVTRNAALLVAAVAAEPIPWVDLALIMPLQVKLVVHIGKIYGFDIRRERARRIIVEVLGAVAYGWAARQALRGVAKVLVPVVGGLVTAPLAYAGTFALGNIAERYFRGLRGDLPPLTDEERTVITVELVERGRRAGERVSADDLAKLRDELRERAARNALPPAED